LEESLLFWNDNLLCLKEIINSSKKDGTEKKGKNLFGKLFSSIFIEAVHSNEWLPFKSIFQEQPKYFNGKGSAWGKKEEWEWKIGVCEREIERERVCVCWRAWLD